MISVPINLEKVNIPKEVKSPLKQTMNKLKQKTEGEPAKTTNGNKETKPEEPPADPTNSEDQNEQPVNLISSILEKLLKGH